MLLTPWIPDLGSPPYFRYPVEDYWKPLNKIYSAIALDYGDIDAGRWYFNLLDWNEDKLFVVQFDLFGKENRHRAMALADGILLRIGCQFISDDKWQELQQKMMLLK